MEKILTNKMVFNGRLLKVYQQRRRYPNGYLGDLELVSHPGAVLIIPLLARGRVILIKQYRPVIDSYIWELPAGTLNKGEPVLDCAKRELAEEISYQADNWQELGSIFPAPGYTTEKIAIFAARGLKKIKAKAEQDELIVPRTFGPIALDELLRSGEIVDAKTICALKLLETLDLAGRYRSHKVTKSPGHT